MTLPRPATITACAILLGCATTRADEGAFSDDDSIENLHPNWMSWVPDDTELADLSIPATHETMALYGL